MGLWVRSPKLSPGEAVKWRASCNWLQGGRSSGGYLWLTPSALVFEPNRIDSAAGGQSRRVALVDIADAGVEPGGHPSMSGGLRPRIRLGLVDGRHELLLLNKIETRLHDIQQAVAGEERQFSVVLRERGTPHTDGAGAAPTRLGPRPTCRAR